MCIVGYFSKCSCGHFSHPDHKLRMGTTSTYAVVCRRCACPTPFAGGSIERPPVLPEYVVKYTNDPEWMKKFLPTLVE